MNAWIGGTALVNMISTKERKDIKDLLTKLFGEMEIKTKGI